MRAGKAARESRPGQVRSRRMWARVAAPRRSDRSRWRVGFVRWDRGDAGSVSTLTPGGPGRPAGAPIIFSAGRSSAGVEPARPCPPSAAPNYPRHKAVPRAQFRGHHRMSRERSPIGCFFFSPIPKCVFCRPPDGTARWCRASVFPLPGPLNPKRHQPLPARRPDGRPGQLFWWRASA